MNARGAEYRKGASDAHTLSVSDDYETLSMAARQCRDIARVDFGYGRPRAYWLGAARELRRLADAARIEELRHAEFGRAGEFDG